MSYAGRHPDHPSKLVLDSTSARLVVERMFPVFERLGGPAAVEAARRFWSDPSQREPRRVRADLHAALQPSPGRDGEEAEMHRSDPDEHRTCLSTSSSKVQPTYDQTPLLATITCPTLVLSGDDDPVTPTACSEEIVAGIDSKLVRFERYAGRPRACSTSNPRRLVRCYGSSSVPERSSAAISPNAAWMRSTQ